MILGLLRAQEYDPCDCQTQDVLVGNLEAKLAYLEQLIERRETEKVVLKKGPDVSRLYYRVYKYGCRGKNYEEGCRFYVLLDNGPKQYDTVNT